MNKMRRLLSCLALLSLLSCPPAFAAEQPVAIFHAFNQPFSDIKLFVCDLAGQGYSHVQIPPAQKSNPSPVWYTRYQPVDLSVIEGMGSEADLRALTDRAHGCGIRVIADVVFNHMTSMAEYKGLDRFPGLTKGDFHTPPCGINYSDGNRDTELTCWLGDPPDLPDLDQTKEAVKTIQKNHIRKLLGLGIDGFRFDAAKHMAAETVKDYIDFIDRESHGATWNYLEVIEDNDTRAEDYNAIAAVTDYVLYKQSLLGAFGFGGDLRSLKAPKAVNDPRSVTFGQSHDTVREHNPGCPMGCWGDTADSWLATSYVLAREQGTPLVLNWDNHDVPYIRAGVQFRRAMVSRAREGRNVKENVLAVVDDRNVMVMERGAEGFYVVNKSTALYDRKALDMTLTSLEGCYRELRQNFTVAIERRDGNKKWITRWGGWGRGGLEIYGREALYFVREPWEACR